MAFVNKYTTRFAAEETQCLCRQKRNEYLALKTSCYKAKSIAAIPEGKMIWSKIRHGTATMGEINHAIGGGPFLKMVYSFLFFFAVGRWMEI